MSDRREQQLRCWRELEHAAGELDECLSGFRGLAKIVRSVRPYFEVPARPEEMAVDLWLRALDDFLDSELNDETGEPTP